jgi:hypothetical protein
MMRVIQRIAAVLCMLAMLASASFAASSCTLCAPHAEKAAVPAQKTSAHDHCGAATHAGKPDGPAVSSSHCGRDGAACITAGKQEFPVAQTLSSAQLVRALASQLENWVEPEKNSFSPPRDAFEPSPALALLAANLRV